MGGEGQTGRGEIRRQRPCFWSCHVSPPHRPTYPRVRLRAGGRLPADFGRQRPPTDHPICTHTPISLHVARAAHERTSSEEELDACAISFPPAGWGRLSTSLSHF